jgi:hypothetical protein
VKDGLKLVDEFSKEMRSKATYFASLAKLVNCTRESARDFFLAWVVVHKDRKGFEFIEQSKRARRMPPRCIAQRWLAISGAEEHWLSLGTSPQHRREMVLPVIQRVFGKYKPIDETKDGPQLH